MKHCAVWSILLQLSCCTQPIRWPASLHRHRYHHRYELQHASMNLNRNSACAFACDAGKEGWEYRDPDGLVQGPYRPTQIIKW